MNRTKWMTAAKKPELDDLVTELDELAGRSGDIFMRQLVADETRRCKWDNQSTDGRKWDTAAKKAFPWNGSADTRVRLADEVINDHVKLAKTAFFQARIQAKAVESGDLQKAQSVSTLLKWLRDGMLHDELRTEVELAAQWVYGDDPGACIVSCLWKRESALEMREVTVQEAIMAAAQAAGSLDAGEDLILSRALEPQAIELFSAAWPQMPVRRLRSALRELRKTGVTELPMAYVKENRPQIKAWRLYHDIFLPSGTTDIQRARIIFSRELLNEVELVERKISEEWDGDWIEAVLEAGPGGCVAGVGSEGSDWNYREFDERQEHLYEVWRAHYRAIDKDTGIPSVQETVFHHAVKDAWAKHGKLDYPNCAYPFTLMTREKLGREISDSRGIAALTVTQQVELKIQLDCRAAATQIGTLPPMKQMRRRGGVALVLAPASIIGVDRMEEMEWLKPPPFPNASIEIENSTRRSVDSYFARPGESTAPSRVTIYAQDLLNDWNGSWKTVYTQALALMQAKMDPIEIERITGQPGDALTKEDIRGRYDLTVEVDARDLDLEFLTMKMEVLGKYVFPADSAGTFDQAGIAQEVLGAVDSRWASRYVRDAGAVSLQEIEDEQSQIVKMTAGIEPPLRERGVNAQLRLQVLDETVKTSPKIQEKLSEPDGLFAKLLENRRKNLQHMVDQENNKKIGRTGTAPVLQAAAAAPAAPGAAPQ